jgi:hypothetical protein
MFTQRRHSHSCEPAASIHSSSFTSGSDGPGPAATGELFPAGQIARADNGGLRNRAGTARVSTSRRPNRRQVRSLKAGMVPSSSTLKRSRSYHWRDGFGHDLRQDLKRRPDYIKDARLWTSGRPRLAFSHAPWPQSVGATTLNSAKSILTRKSADFPDFSSRLITPNRSNGRPEGRTLEAADM